MSGSENFASQLYVMVDCYIIDDNVTMNTESSGANILELELELDSCSVIYCSSIEDCRTRALRSPIRTAFRSEKI